MHPLFGHRVRVALYVLAWLLAGLPLALFVTALVPQATSRANLFALPLTLLYGFIVLSALWVCRANPLTGGRPLPAVVLSQLGAALQASAVWGVTGAVWALALNWLVGRGPDRAGIFTEVAVLFAAGIPLYVLSAVVHYLFLAFEASHAAQRRVLETEVSAREAELRALRAQLNPHFLFNSLNSIASLVGSDPEGARRMCERLGDFLRRTLALGARDAVTLGEELELVDRYLAIEQVRFGARLAFDRRIGPGALECVVPPLLLQPLVENAVKHGVADRVEGGTIVVEANRDADLLRILVENPLDEEAPSRRGSGLGLENVRRRLDAYGAQEARLEARRDGGMFRVSLTLPALAANGEAGRG
ncbi:MAG: histidine kinase [Candidatus Eisenbacteria bacterium]|nr:histidine kinase [Candidatus Eisenbacteria bacterium]